MFGEESKLVRERKDNTTITLEPDRILDSLAKLLAVGSGSVCIAVSIIEGQIIISSNDLCSASKGRKTGEASEQEKKLVRIYDYFKNIATSQKIPEDKDRKRMFKEIWSEAKFETKGHTFFTLLGVENKEDIGDSFIKNVFEKSIPKKLKRRPIHAAAYASCLDLYTAFEKLESIFLNSGKAKSNKTLESKTEMGIENTHVEFCSDAFILKEESEKGVHAEI